MIFSEKLYGFWIVIVGLVVLLGISLSAVFRYAGVAEASSVITAAGMVIGTVVGTFFGVHVGSAAGTASAQQAETGRQQAETARSQAEDAKNTVIGGLSKVAAAATPGSPPAVAIQELVDSINLVGRH